MIDNKIFTGGMDTDLDERLIKADDYRYALNIRNISGNEGQVGVIQNVKGNTPITISLPSGANKVLGSVVDYDSNSAYFFVYNSNNDHSIYRYDSIVGGITNLITSEYLEFIKHNPIVGTIIENTLYFTDGFHEPKKINITRALDGEYSGITSTQFLEVIQYPPIAAPTAVYVNNSKLKSNLIKNKFFQFRYRYYYIDGEISAWSPISESMLNIHLMDLELSNDEQYNAINITVNSGKSIVKKIEIAVRNSAVNDFNSEIILDKEQDSIDDNVSYVYQFKNNRIVTFLNTNDLDKLYDDVPKSARAIGSTSDNRLLFGDVTMGFDNIKPQYSIVPSYQSDTALYTDSSSTYGVTTFIGSSSSVTQTNGSALSTSTYYAEILHSASVDFSSMPSSIPNKARFELVVNYKLTTPISDDGSTATGHSYISSKNYSLNIFNDSGSAISKNDFLNDIVDAFTNAQSTGNANFGTVSASATLSNSTITFKVTHIGDADTNVTLSGNITTHSVTFSLIQIAENIMYGSSFKGGSEYNFGVVYFDRANRASYVQLSDNNAVYFDATHERPWEKRGRAYANWYLYNTPPSWATHYQWVYAPKNDTANFQYMMVDQVGLPSNNNDTTSLYLDVTSWYNKITEFSTQSGLNFSWLTRGNMVRVYMFEAGAHGNTPGSHTLTAQPILFELLDLHFASSTSSDVQTFSDGVFLKVDPLHTVAGFTRADYSKFEHAIIEVYSIEREDPEVQVYYEIGQKYDIGNAHGSTRYHKGDSVNQSAVESSLVLDSNILYFDVDGKLRMNYDASSSAVKSSLNAITVGQVVKFLNSSSNVLGYALVEQTHSSYNFIQLDVKYDSTIHNTSTISTAKKITPATGKFENGDIYWRERKFVITNDNGATAGIHSEFVEDKYQNDQYGEDSRNLGRAHINSKFARQLRKKNTIVYSDIYSRDDNFNGLSVFYTTNKKELKESLGAITYISDFGDVLFVLQENGTSLIQMRKQVLTTASGNSIVALSGDVLSEPQYMNDLCGLQHPSLFLDSEDNKYWIDLRRKSIFRLKGNQAEPISAYGMRNFFNEKIGNYEKYSMAMSSILGYDQQHGEVLSTFKSLTKASTASVTLSDETEHTLSFVSFLVENHNGLDAGWEIPMRFISGVGKSTYNLNDVCSIGYIELDNQLTYGNSSVNISLFVDTDVVGGLTLTRSTVISKGTLQNFSETAPSINTYSLSTSTDTGVTLCFNVGTSKWTSYYSFVPEMYVGINNAFLSFVNGAPWLHNVNSTYNSYYGSTYNTQLHSIFNKNQSEVSFYKYLNLKGNSAWDISYSTDYNTGSLNKDAVCVGASGSDRLTCELNGGVFVSDFREIDGYYYADFRRDGSNGIEGDKPKGYYVKLEMDNDSTSLIKLFSMGVSSDVLLPIES